MATEDEMARVEAADQAHSSAGRHCGEVATLFAKQAQLRDELSEIESSLQQRSSNRIR